MPQIYDVLKQDHREIQRMLEGITSGKPTARAFGELYAALEAHQQAEEKTIYRDLMEPEATHDTVLEGIEEHHVADMLLKELTKLQPRDERFAAKLSVLKENVLHHVKEEERTLFPSAKKVCDKQWAELSAEKFETQEQTLKQKLSAKMK